MSEQLHTTTDKTNQQRELLQWLSCYLIGVFLWRLLIPAHEYPSRLVQVMTIGWDLLIVIIVIGLGQTISFTNQPDQPAWPHGKLLFWLALVAGVGLFLLRVHSHAGWWTGHLQFSLR